MNAISAKTVHVDVHVCERSKGMDADEEPNGASGAERAVSKSAADDIKNRQQTISVTEG